MQQYLPNYVPIVLVLIGIVVVVRLFAKKPRKPTTDADLAALCRYFDNVNATRAFPVVQLRFLAASTRRERTSKGDDNLGHTNG
jgi:hypothetical protein